MSAILEELDGAVSVVQSLRAQRDDLAVKLWKQGVSQYVIADQLGLSQPYISRLVCRARRASLLRSAQQTMQDGTTEGEPTMTTTATTVAVDEAKRAHERAEREFNRVLNTSDPRLIRAASAELKETYHRWRTLQGA